MQFTLTMDVPPVDRPGIPIAQALRDAADLIETQIPLTERTIHDRYGVKVCEWKVVEPE
jgi:hypothetical protein